MFTRSQLLFKRTCWIAPWSARLSSLLLLVIVGRWNSVVISAQYHCLKTLEYLINQSNLPRKQICLTPEVLEIANYFVEIVPEECPAYTLVAWITGLKKEMWKNCFALLEEFAKFRSKMDSVLSNLRIAGMFVAKFVGTFSQFFCQAI